MKILVVHNAYQQRGGEDMVVEAEVELLRSRGHSVTMYRRDNHELASIGGATAAMDTLWSRRTVDDIEHRLKLDAPDLIHAHNTFPLISPSLYWACARAGVPVVQTLHNFRLLCPQAMLLRDGKVCELCVGKAPLPGVIHGCYRGSRAQTAVLAGMLLLHRAVGTWTDKVARYIALNEFCRAKFIEGGLPASRIVVKPNFVDFDSPAPVERTGFLFVGRLSPEKGLSVLGRAAALVPESRVTIVGTGPDQALAASIRGATLLGALSRNEVFDQMRRSNSLILPSICNETFGLVAVEAFACGTPVIASQIGGLSDLVTDGVNGLLFEPGSPIDLAQKMRWALNNPARMAEMGRNARALYEANFTAARNYARLMDIYSQAIDSPSERTPAMRSKP